MIRFSLDACLMIRFSLGERDVKGMAGGSVIGRQAEQLWLKVLHGPQHQRGLLSKATVQVVIRYHHHLHPSRQARLHPVRSVFKHQALSQERTEG